MEKQLLSVLVFQKGVNAPLPETPTMLSDERRELRQRLLQEEVNALASAENMNDVADAIVDCLYILLGTAHEFGIADRLPQLFDEVHRSNMSKFDENGKAIYREDGKVIKPDTYRAPKLDSILAKDFTAFKENAPLLEDVFDKINREEFNAFMDKVNNTIRLHLNTFELFAFDQISEAATILKDVITIDIVSNDMVTGRKAKVSVKDKEFIVEEHNGY
jgi:predicted HAD superfamily Cof-like phosphohydrolase